MSDPVFRPLNLGDTADDDGQVIDSLVVEVDAPPDPLQEPIDSTPLIEEKVPTKLISVRQRVDPAWSGATMLLPADTNRKSMHIRCRIVTGGDSANDAVVLSSDAKATGNLAPLAAANTAGLDMNFHTGALWATAIGVNAVYVDVWAVTE